MTASERPRRDGRGPLHGGHFDALVVGSGFGGSVTACRLAEAGLDVCVLERGKTYPPGSFARSPRELAANVWDLPAGLQGLFDVRWFRGLGAVVSSGLGGGSLIYANVLLRPEREWFRLDDPRDGSVLPWPVGCDALEEFYALVEDRLGANPYPFPDRTAKTRAFREAARAAGHAPLLPNLGVTFADREGRLGPGLPLGNGNLHGARRETCRLCGECDTGCNYGAKNTLDLTYLSTAAEHGAELHERIEVRAFEPIDGGFRVRAVEHRDGPPAAASELPELTLTCRHLVLAAGTLGTTFLLLRNRGALPRLSPLVGTRFSGNGDYLAFAHGCREPGGGIRPLEPSRGPVITSALRVADEHDGGDGPGYYIEDGGYPSWMLQALDLPRPAARLVRRRLRGGPDVLPLLAMGRDVPDGVMRLAGGRLEIDWRKGGSARLYQRTGTTMRELTRRLGGRYADPLRWLRPITVHPLGGCPMGWTDARDGVVDSFGSVHGYPRLSIADGSILPGPIGANPSLTIAALAERHARRLAGELKGA